MEKLVRITTVPKSLSRLLEGQLKYMTDFYEVHGVSSPGELLEEVAQREGIQTHAIPLSRKLTPFKDLVSIFRMFRLLRKLKPAIVHTHTPKAGMVGMVAAKLARVPIRLHTIAGMPVETRKGFIRFLLLMAERLTFSCAHFVFPNSNGMADFVKTHNLCKASKTKIIGHGSSNGINLDRFIATEEIVNQGRELRAKHGVPTDGFLFGFVGRVVKDKGIDELMWAFDSLAKSNPNFHLMVVGDFDSKLNPIDPFSRSTLENHPQIHYAGYQTDVRPYFAAFDTFVFPSYREGLPNVLLQAGAMGKPAVATAINGSMDIIENGVNGILVPAMEKEPLKEAMLRLAENNDLREKLASAARPMVEKHYDQKKLWFALKEEYCSLIKLSGI